ncbi:hypothetical protein SAMN05216349_13413 [Oribacterium sp. KHPX15]|uniref:hypothetical protein n=1 Tax=Oribacterium sp. KHPX15 TaxID=1855342 RepID=UPI0008992C75|nr:hypothetical protein [Oribacterium sp. KHPX15]SEA83461.1 hypothetical protein SAMN05216349_13413 [Oribacterium sp. KHPX15]
MNKRSKYLCTDRIIGKFKNNYCYIYGTGKDAGDLFDLIKEFVVVKGFINSYKDDYLFKEVNVIARNECSDRKIRGHIIVATYKYEDEIYESLKQLGFVEGEDFYIWDRFSYHDTSDKWINKYIEWNRTAWKKCNRPTDNRRILMAAMDDEGFRSLLYGYFSELLCNQYDAKPEAYISFRFDYKYEGQVKQPYKTFGFDKIGCITRSIYETFGVTEFLSAELDKVQSDEVCKLTNDIWLNINSYEDWEKIQIDGVEFGTTIIRCLSRFLIPCFDPKDARLKDYLQRCVENIIFWRDRFNSYDYKFVLLRDGVSWDGFIRDIAISRGIPAMCVSFQDTRRVDLNFSSCKENIYFAAFWNELNIDERERALLIGKKYLESHLKGAYSKKLLSSNFGNEIMDFHLAEDDRIKILICPHIFCEDQFPYGDQIFDNSVFSWLVHLGELSEKLSKYDWYIKKHPHATISPRDNEIINSFIEKFPNIHLIPTEISPIQLKNEGIRYVLTVYGTAGCEYPAIGIKVITAGVTPYEGFNFTIKPKTKDEFDHIIENLEYDNSVIDTEDLYKYWALNLGYYDWDYNEVHLFHNEELNSIAGRIKRGEQMNWNYQLLMEELGTEGIHDENRAKIKKIFDRAMSWEPSKFYRKRIILGVEE